MEQVETWVLISFIEVGIECHIHHSGMLQHQMALQENHVYVKAFEPTSIV
jgi:hypothetical protein